MVGFRAMPFAVAMQRMVGFRVITFTGVLNGWFQCLVFFFRCYAADGCL